MRPAPSFAGAFVWFSLGGRGHTSRLSVRGCGAASRRHSDFVSHVLNDGSQRVRPLATLATLSLTDNRVARRRRRGRRAAYSSSGRALAPRTSRSETDRGHRDARALFARDAKPCRPLPGASSRWETMPSGSTDESPSKRQRQQRATARGTIARLRLQCVLPPATTPHLLAPSSRPTLTNPASHALRRAATSCRTATRRSPTRVRSSTASSGPTAPENRGVRPVGDSAHPACPAGLRGGRAP